MLDTFRKHSNSTLIYLIFGALIVVFVVSFGQGSQGFKSGSLTGSTEFAAKVNDESISIHDFNRQYRLQLAQIEQRAGQPINEELAERMGFRKQALESLVNTTLLVQEAKKRGLAVGDAELAAELQKVPSFQKDGAFDKDAYEKVLTYQNTTPDEFEAKERDALLAQKMASIVMGSAVVTDEEVHAEFVKEHDRANVTFVRFLPSQFVSEVKLNPSDAELDAFVAAHGPQIEEFYNRNGFRYHKPQRYEAKDILVKVEEGASADDDAKAKAKADQAYQALKAGKPFGDVAKQFSDDATTKDKGGDMGTLSPGLDKALDAAVSKLQPGQFTEPVKTHFGYQIIQVNKVLPPEDKKLDDVKKDIALELMKTDAAKTLAQQKAEEALKAAQAGKKLEEQYPAEEKKEGEVNFAAANKVEAQETGTFSAGEFVPRIGQAPEIAQAAFQLTADKPVAPKVFQNANAYYVVELKAHEKPAEADFEKAKEDLRQAMLSRKQNDILTGFLKELRDSGKVEENQALTMPQQGGQPS
ncbi:MAG: SurA N-terminal domain-containing protein [Deltaproteobacteria bacterium]|nr:SurA N-terminal domain-containing protein [Deltaproteobacteria bacterium]